MRGSALCPGMGTAVLSGFAVGLRPAIVSSRSRKDGLKVCILRKGMKKGTCSLTPYNLDIVTSYTHTPRFSTLKLRRTNTVSLSQD